MRPNTIDPSDVFPIEELELQVLTLARDGWQNTQIAKHLGITQTRLHSIKRSALIAWKKANRALQSEQFAINFLRLEYLWGVVLERLSVKDLPAKEFEGLVRTAVDILKRQSAQLGVDLEQKLPSKDYSAKDIEDGIAAMHKSVRPARFGTENKSSESVTASPSDSTPS